VVFNCSHAFSGDSDQAATAIALPEFSLSNPSSEDFSAVLPLFLLAAAQEPALFIFPSE